MGVFAAILISTSILTYLSRIMEKRGKYIGSKYFFILAAIIIILVPALRNNIGDTYVYVSMYDQLGEAPTTLKGLMEIEDWGYTVFTLILYNISKNPQIMIFTTAAITQILYLKFFRKHRSLMELEIFMYIASGYYLTTMNGIRQALAAGFILFATKYIFEKKFVKYLIVILITSTIHGSAVIMIPLYFLTQMKPWTKKTFGIILIASIGFFGFYKFMPMLFGMLGETQYGHYEDVFLTGMEPGANIIRLFVALVPLVLSFYRRKELEKWKYSRVFINMSIINFIFMMFSLHTWIFARFTMYFNLYNIVLIPYIIKTWGKGKERRLIYLGYILCYFVFFIIEHRGWQIGTNYTITRLFYSL